MAKKVKSKRKVAKKKKELYFYYAEGETSNQDPFQDGGGAERHASLQDYINSKEVKDSLDVISGDNERSVFIYQRVAVITPKSGATVDLKNFDIKLD